MPVEVSRLSLKSEAARQIALACCGEWKRWSEIRSESGVPGQSVKWYLDWMVTKRIIERRRSGHCPLNGVTYEYRLRGT